MYSCASSCRQLRKLLEMAVDFRVKDYNSEFSFFCTNNDNVENEAQLHELTQRKELLAPKEKQEK